MSTLSECNKNRCTSCKHFVRTMTPAKTWEERVDMYLQKYPGMPDEEAHVLASSRNLCLVEDEFWGKCKHAIMPELRDVVLDGRKFGCIHYNKTARK